MRPFFIQVLASAVKSIVPDHLKQKMKTFDFWFSVGVCLTMMCFIVYITHQAEMKNKSKEESKQVTINLQP